MAVVIHCFMPDAKSARCNLKIGRRSADPPGPFFNRQHPTDARSGGPEFRWLNTNGDRGEPNARGPWNDGKRSATTSKKDGWWYKPYSSFTRSFRGPLSLQNLLSGVAAGQRPAPDTSQISARLNYRPPFTSLRRPNNQEYSQWRRSVGVVPVANSPRARPQLARSNTCGSQWQRWTRSGTETTRY